MLSLVVGELTNVSEALTLNQNNQRLPKDDVSIAIKNTSTNQQVKTKATNISVAFFVLGYVDQH